MHTSWLNRNDQTDPKQSLDEPSHTSTIDLSRPSADLVDEKPAQRAATTTLPTPHDALLAELHGRATAADMPTNETLATENQPLGRLNNPHRVGSTLSELSSTSEPLFDPFTGALIGDLLPGDGEQDRGAENEDLWTHLSKILRLQSDIAEMHVQMEGIGLKKPGVAPGKSKGEGIHGRPSADGTREWGENAADERVDEDADEEAENKRKREEEFAGLNDKFTGRKDAIDGIMKNVKLDELSSALTTFHGLRTPIIDFQNNPKSASGNTSTSFLSKSVSPPDPIHIPPITSASVPLAAMSSGSQKWQPSTRVLPLHGEASTAVVDSPDSMRVALPDEDAL